MNRILLICLCLFFFNCSKNDSPGGHEARIDQNDQKIVPGGTLVAGIISEPDVLNPLTALSRTAQNVLAVLYRQLGKLNADMVSYSPELAKAWFFSEDSLTITFRLRTDVFWHDSTLFTAKDVLFTHTLQTDPTVGWVGISLKQNISAVEAPNDSIIVFRFTKRTPTMLMEAIEGYIVPQHILGKLDPTEIPNSPFNRQPVGTGPFKFKDWTSQQTLVLERFEAYYEPGKPYLDRIIFKVVSDNINLWLQVKSGDVDFMEGVPARDFNNLVSDWEAGNSNVRPLRYPGRQYDFIGWNLIDYDNYSAKLKAAGDTQPEINELLEPHALFGSQKVRAALTMALDRAALVELVTQGLATQMDGPIPPIFWAYNQTANRIWPYDPDLAKQYLKEAGWEDSNGDGILDKTGQPFSFEMLSNSGNKRREQSLTIIQEQLANIGVAMQPRMVEPSLLFGRLLPTRNFDAILIGWNASSNLELAPIFHSSNFFTPFCFTSFYSTDFDRWEMEARSLLDQSKAQLMWDKVASLLSTELPYTWLYYRDDASALSSRFKGAIFDKRGAYINLEDWWIPLEERTQADRLTVRNN